MLHEAQQRWWLGRVAQELVTLFGKPLKRPPARELLLLLLLLHKSVPGSVLELLPFEQLLLLTRFSMQLPQRRFQELPCCRDVEMAGGDMHAILTMICPLLRSPPLRQQEGLRRWR